MYYRIYPLNFLLIPFSYKRKNMVRVRVTRAEINDVLENNFTCDAYKINLVRFRLYMY